VRAARAVRLHLADCGWRVSLFLPAALQQEDVWKREQAKAQEEKRLDELKKQIAEEREAQELLRVAQDAGHATCVPTL
jgi:hypothetical protein